MILQLGGGSIGLLLLVCSILRIRKQQGRNRLIACCGGDCVLAGTHPAGTRALEESGGIIASGWFTALICDCSVFVDLISHNSETGQHTSLVLEGDLELPAYRVLQGAEMRRRSENYTEDLDSVFKSDRELQVNCN